MKRGYKTRIFLLKECLSKNTIPSKIGSFLQSQVEKCFTLETEIINIIIITFFTIARLTEICYDVYLLSPELKQIYTPHRYQESIVIISESTNDQVPDLNEPFKNKTHFQIIHILCLCLYGVSFLIFITVGQVLHRRIISKNIFIYGNTTTKKPSPFAKFKNIKYKSLKNDSNSSSDDDDNSSDIDDYSNDNDAKKNKSQLLSKDLESQLEFIKTNQNNKHNSNDKLILNGQNLKYIDETSSIFVIIFGENVFYSLGMILCLHLLDMILILASSLYLSDKNAYAEFFLLIYSLMVFLISILYTVFDVALLNARTLVFPYLLILLTIIGIVFELSPYHPNRIYIDIVCGCIVFYILLIALPVHFWRTSIEFVKRKKLEQSKKEI